MRIYKIADGEQLVKAARNSIELLITNPHFKKTLIKKMLDEFERPHGVFVTLYHYPTMELRGCIGFPRAIGPLGESLVDAAIAAAFEDPRFVPVSRQELGDMVVEVSILTSPSPIIGGERKRIQSIQIGRDGLMVQYGLYSGLLLPIVAAEQKWDRRKFFEETCRKAGLHADYWKQPNVSFYKFETQVFREESPEGKVIEVKLDNVK